MSEKALVLPVLADVRVEGCDEGIVRGAAPLRDGGIIAFFHDGSIRRCPRTP